MAIQDRLRFPSEEEIINYLVKHPSTCAEKNPEFTEKKIVQAVAHYFANKITTSEGVINGLKITYRELKDINISIDTLKSIYPNLNQALVDCGKVAKL